VIANRSREELRRLVAPGVLLLALTVSGCGDKEDDDGVATAGGEASESGDAAEMDTRDRMLAFTECLRDNGLDVEDPAEGEGVKLEFGPETDRSTVEAAMEACREFAPEGGPGGGPVDSEAMLEFAECMRENGVEAFPDPDPDQGGMMINRDVAEDPDFEAAQAACEDILGDLRPGGGA
jgi:hypothetical protein